MKRKTNKRTYNFKYYPTRLLKEIIDSEPYCTCNNGHDYSDYINEIKKEYWTRSIETFFNTKRKV